ncbi:hypothetical protein [Formosa algae]|uniref:Uncharacterized protein n=1 Tax=Formosa algae TaxID=225843 RepID=A0A9X0YMS0_9FLAO|nr:hypothetical protein [Formosa algae]MBP1841494.1 hypothetical protein [Formosa algae]MDQ0336584.1 hypothetical protein [Formosa algae]OEI81952.1 hypothetical protein AST99_02005 [Formosa algae]
MKLVIVTSVGDFQKEILRLFKKANIENFSSSDIEGFKNNTSVLMESQWFSGEKLSNASDLFFSFTEDKHIDTLFDLIKAFNANLETNNPIRAIVVPVERFI